MNADNLSSKSASAGLLAAIVASLCCITPVFSFLAGIGGIAATFSWMEPFRPYLITLTIGALGFAWYQKFKPRTKEEIECACETDEKPSFWQSRKFLVIVTVFATLMLSFPSYSHMFYLNDGSQSNSIMIEQDTTKTYKLELQVKGMTCAGCENHIINSVNKLDGIDRYKAFHTQGKAIVTYDPKKVTKSEIIEAINSTGYKVIEKKNQE